MCDFVVTNISVKNHTKLPFIDARILKRAAERIMLPPSPTTVIILRNLLRYPSNIQEYPQTLRPLHRPLLPVAREQ